MYIHVEISSKPSLPVAEETFRSGCFPGLGKAPTKCVCMHVCVCVCVGGEGVGRCSGVEMFW